MENFKINLIGTDSQVAIATSLIKKLEIAIEKNASMSERKREKIEKKYGDSAILAAIKLVNSEDGELNASNVRMILNNQKQEKMGVDMGAFTFEERLRS